MNAYHQAVGQIPGELGRALQQLPDHTTDKVLEVRLRTGRPVVLTLKEKNLPLPQLPRPTIQELQQILEALCGYSVYSWQDSICKGYITLQGGHRVGIAGKVVTKQNTITTVQPITSLNIRIARETKFVLPLSIQELLLKKQNGIVIAGAPASGKTTLLKQLVWMFSEQGQRVCVVDERCELAGSGLPLHCDVLQNCSKAEGLLWAVRGLSPQILICDEVGAQEDAAAVVAAANAGVRLLVSMHGENKQQLFRRPFCRQVLETGAFSTIVFLQQGEKLGQIGEVIEL